MKKFAKILVVSMLLLSVVLTFASCGAIKDKLGLSFKLEDAQEKLDEERYTTEILTNEYYVYVQLNVLFPYVDLSERPEAILVASDEKGDNVFYALEFESEDSAKEAYAALEPEIEYFVEEFNDKRENKELDDMGFSWKRKDKVVYFGTVDAVKLITSFPANLFVFAK